MSAKMNIYVCNPIVLVCDIDQFLTLHKIILRNKLKIIPREMYNITCLTYISVNGLLTTSVINWKNVSIIENTIGFVPFKENVYYMDNLLIIITKILENIKSCNRFTLGYSSESHIKEIQHKYPFNCSFCF